MSSSVLLSLYCLAIVVIAASSGTIALLARGSSRRLELFLALSAGVVLGVVGLHMIPEAFEAAGAGASLALITGFVFMLVVERFVLPHALHAPHAGEAHAHCDPEVEKEHARAEAAGLGAFFGLAMHTLADGLALGAAVREGHSGAFVFIAIVAHKIPSAFALGSILVRAGFNSRIVVAASALLGAAVGVGALLYVGSSVLGQFDPELVTPWAVAFSAGSFLHVAVTDLLPDLHRKRRWGLFVALVLGLLSVLLLGELLHEH